MLDGVFNHCGYYFKPWQDVLEKGPESEYFDWFMVNQWPIDRDWNAAKKGQLYTFAFFDSMPKIVKEGRRTINNVERSATLFLSKTIYASLLALLFLFINYTYPFIPIQMTLINSLTIGIPAFILALEPNKSRVKGKFFINVVSKAIPSGITTVVNILILVLVASLLKIPGTQTSTCAVIITAYTALLLIYRISKPLNLLRKSLLFVLSIIFLLALVTPIGRSIFSLEILTPNSLLILLPLMYISTRLFKLLSNLLNMVIERKRSWFM